MGKHDKRKPYTPATAWDQGPRSLAAIGDPAEIAAGFRSWLRANPKQAEPRRVKEVGKRTTRMETSEEAMRRCAQVFTAKHGVHPVIEAASYVDPETGKDVNPNGVKRVRRIDVVEMYQRKGVLSRDQVAAALQLRQAYEATKKSPPAIKAVQVDTSPKPDQHVAIMMDRMSAFVKIMALVPAAQREIIDCVVLENRTPMWLGKYRGAAGAARGVRRMQEALTDLHDRMTR